MMIGFCRSRSEDDRLNLFPSLRFVKGFSVHRLPLFFVGLPGGGAGGTVVREVGLTLGETGEV